jgi:hypothetical protein
MKIRDLLGATFLILGTAGVVFVFGAYNDNNFSYRGDGMIMINGEVFYPVGVYFIPCCNRRLNTDLLEEIGPDGENRAFLFQEFAAQGGNFIAGPSFHYHLRNVYYSVPPWWDDCMPLDLTDIHENMEGLKDIKMDLAAAAPYGVKMIADPCLTYSWTRALGPSGDHYFVQEYHKGKAILEMEKEFIKIYLHDRPYAERESYFNDIKSAVESPGGETAFFGWSGGQEPAWIPWHLNHVNKPTVEHLEEVYNHIRSLETGEGANHPVCFEEPSVAIIADLYRQYHAYCDIVGYNSKASPAPSRYNNWSPDFKYVFTTNAWCSVTGDHADLQFCMVDGAKPVTCCLDGVPNDDMGYRLWDHQVRFVTYDAIIHRVNGVSWGMWHYVFPTKTGSPYWVPGDEYEYDIKPTLMEIGLPLAEGGVNEVIKSEFDDVMVEAVVKLNGEIVERTAFVGGELAPKNHFLSGNYLLEGCVKQVTEEVGPGVYLEFVYLITACRKGRDTFTHEPFDEYEITFKPYFSGDWLATYVERREPDGTFTQVPVSNGAFADTFVGEDVHIYKFRKPPRFGEG